MSARLVFVVTVADAEAFDQKHETRRITLECGAHWNEMYRLMDHVTEVKCGPEFPCLHMFSRIFCLDNKDMTISDAFDITKYKSDQRRTWGIISTMTNCGMVIINHAVTHVMVAHVKRAPELAANKLYCLVFRKDAEPELHDTMGMAPSDFLALVEEAGVRVPTGR